VFTVGVGVFVVIYVHACVVDGVDSVAVVDAGVAVVVAVPVSGNVAVSIPVFNVVGVAAVVDGVIAVAFPSNDGGGVDVYGGAGVDGVAVAGMWVWC